MCIENDIVEFKNLCKTWYNTIKIDKKYNSRNSTASVSQEIRYYTTLKAYELCIEFVEKMDPKVPDAILERKIINGGKDENNIHNYIPDNKFEFGGIGKSMNPVIKEECRITGNRENEVIKKFTTEDETKKGGKRKSIGRKLRNKRNSHKNRRC
jgi:hypothetical protein